VRKILLLFALLAPLAGFAQSPWSITWTTAAGGGGTSSNSPWTMIDEIGQPGALMAGGNFVMNAGFVGPVTTPAGALQVNLGPANALSESPEWQVDGVGNFYTSGQTANGVPAGIHTINFTPIAGYGTPANLTVNIVNDATTVTNASYITDYGSLQVTISPTGPVTAGAQWKVNGGSNQNSGAILTNLLAGEYLISFVPVSGWTAPLDQFVMVAAGSNTRLNGAYTTSSAPGNQLTLVTNGAGTITHGRWPATLVAGDKYTVKAMPAPHNFFLNWTGGTSSPYPVVSASASYTFTYEPDLTLLQANFVTNIFLVAQGAYNGLFAVPYTAREQASSGAFNLTVSATGMVSGNLYLGAQTVSLKGQFGDDGSVAIETKPRGGVALTTSLVLDPTNQSILGTVSNQNFVAVLTGYQNVFNAHNRATAYMGRYTLIIPGVTNPAVGPYGMSYGTVTVSPAGAITFAGSLADGTAVSQSSAVSQEGYWPMYVSLYNGNGSLWSWNLFNSNGTVSAASVSWIDATNESKTASYRAGFTNQAATLSGGLYVSSAVPLLNLKSGEVTLEGGGLATPITNQISLASNDRITLASKTEDTNQLTLTITKTTGLISGSFATTAKAKQTIKVSGVLLQGQTNAQGYFLGGEESGTFLLAPP
jgi:hypothetical protein